MLVDANASQIAQKAQKVQKFKKLKKFKKIQQFKKQILMPAKKLKNSKS